MTVVHPIFTLGLPGLTMAGSGSVTAGAGSGSDTPDYVDPVAAVTLLGGRRIVNVATDGQLTTALNDAQAGDTIRLANATYATDRTIDQTFPSNNPLIIEAVNGSPTWGAVATGTWTTTGNHNIIKGIKFTGTGARVNTRGTNNKWLACGFTGTKTKAIQLGVEASAGQQSEIAYCEFWELNEAAGDTFRQAIKMGTAGSGFPETAQDDIWIHHCYFHDIDTAQYNQGDLIEWGESGVYDWVKTRRIGLYFEDNLIDGFFRGSNTTIDAKIGGCVIRRNTQVNGSGATKFDMRQGEACIIESNWLQPGNITTQSRDHIVVGNRVTSIHVNAGETGPDEFSNDHPASFDVLVTGNNGSLTVGRQPNGSYDVAASGTIVEDHTGGITYALEVNTTKTPAVASSRNFPAAFELQVADVGPAAITNASAAYKAARDI